MTNGTDEIDEMDDLPLEVLSEISAKRLAPYVMALRKREMQNAEFADSLVQQRDKLLEALKPFSALLQSHNKNGNDSLPIFGINDATITLGHLRAAEKIIAEVEAGE